MKNLIKITNKSVLVNFEFPITVGQVKLDAVCQVNIYKAYKDNKISADFEFMDQINETYMDMPVEGFGAWKKLREFHTGFGIDLCALVTKEFYKVVTSEFKEEFLRQYDVKDF